MFSCTVSVFLNAELILNMIQTVMINRTNSPGVCCVQKTKKPMKSVLVIVSGNDVRSPSVLLGFGTRVSLNASLECLLAPVFGSPIVQVAYAHCSRSTGGRTCLFLFVSPIKLVMDNCCLRCTSLMLLGSPFLCFSKRCICVLLIFIFS